MRDRTADRDRAKRRAKRRERDDAAREDDRFRPFREGKRWEGRKGGVSTLSKLEPYQRDKETEREMVFKYTHEESSRVEHV